MNSDPQRKEHALDEKLRAWSVATPLPPRFRDQVWQRIARAEARAEPPLATSLLRLLEAVFTRPRVAYAYIAVLLAAGVGAGAWAAQRENNRLDATLGSQYVQSVDPYHAPH